VTDIEQVTGSARDGAGEVAETAVEQVQQVADTAVDEVGNVVATAADQARELLGDLATELSQKADEQAGRLGERLLDVSSQLWSMAAGSEQQGLATSAARTLGDHTERLADRLVHEGAAGLADDVRRYARNNPGTFLLGALAAGVAAGRLTRGARDAGQRQPRARTAPGGPARAARAATQPGVTAPLPGVVAPPSVVAPSVAAAPPTTPVGTPSAPPPPVPYVDDAPAGGAADVPERRP
jgi:polyhydroxyalkanoate synthesis regulator phasin